jgi:hypothetical protein
MSKVLVLCYSSYGHVEAMAAAVAEGALETDGDGIIRPHLIKTFALKPIRRSDPQK